LSSLKDAEEIIGFGLPHGLRTPGNGADIHAEGFDNLVASIKEAGEIKGGKKKPSRLYEIDAPEIKMVREALHG